jgi:hypothetical protein
MTSVERNVAGFEMQRLTTATDINSLAPQHALKTMSMRHVDSVEHLRTVDFHFMYYSFF